MEKGTWKRTLLAISSVSLLGMCETKFIERMFGKVVVTQRMKLGAQAHKKLELKLPKLEKVDIVKQIMKGERFSAREIPVTDKTMGITGRIDQLDFLGEIVNGKSAAMIVDDKYSRHASFELPLNYKLQLSAYASALHASTEYGDICTATGAKLVFREDKTDNVLISYNIGNEELNECVAHVGTAAKTAWELYEHRKEPEHRRFDVYSNEWVGCYCNF